MDRDVHLIVNPSAGAGRAAKLLPDVEAALRSHGLAFRVDRTTSIEHARELAQSAREAGAVAAAMGGDGIAGAVCGRRQHVLGAIDQGRTGKRNLRIAGHVAGDAVGKSRLHHE